MRNLDNGQTSKIRKSLGKLAIMYNYQRSFHVASISSQFVMKLITKIRFWLYTRRRQIVLLILIFCAVFITSRIYIEITSASHDHTTDLRNGPIKHPLTVKDSFRKAKISQKTNLLFLKTHKCGTSTLFGSFLVAAVRKKMNLLMKPNGNFIHNDVPHLAGILPPRPGPNCYNT